MKRKCKNRLLKDLDSKIVFLTGPRQVGKTWLAREIANEFENSVYLNYENYNDRGSIEKETWPRSTDLLIIDEIHKMPDWKTYIKGVYDTKPEKLKILVTSSVRLEYFRQTDDSLSGNFITHQLFPFSPGELAAIDEEPDIDRLIKQGGFPEPFLSKDNDFVQRWHKQYIDGLICDSVPDFEKITDFKSLKLCLESLQNRVGSPVSYTSIAKEIGISPNTVRKYIKIFEELYIIFRVTPFVGNIARSVLKEPKFYFFDTALVDGDESIKFENLTALAMAKEAVAQKDLNGISIDLHYLRTKDSKEVTFCFVKDGIAQFLMETKLSDSSISKNLYYFCDRYEIRGIQLVKNLRRERKDGLKIPIDVRFADGFLIDME